MMPPDNSALIQNVVTSQSIVHLTFCPIPPSDLGELATISRNLALFGKLEDFLLHSTARAYMTLGW